MISIDSDDGPHETDVASDDGDAKDEYNSNSDLPLGEEMTTANSLPLSNIETTTPTSKIAERF